jgi:geranylgeranyl reductase family protein
MKKAVIIGGGVIGLILARELGKSGIDATLYEVKRHIDEGASKASGILSKEGLASMGVDSKRIIVNTLNGAVLHAGNEKLKIKAPETKAYIVDRGLLAEECYKEALDAGAEIVLGKRISKQDIIELKDDRDNVVIGADGAVSNVASACGFPEIKEYVLTYKAEYDRINMADHHSVDLFFSNEVSNRFFGWIAPYSSSLAEIGIGISSFAKSSSSAAFKRFLKNETIERMLSKAEPVSGHASVIPLSTRRHTVRGNVLLVGDAAGQVKATTGGGIVFGTACAKIAARALYDHIKNGKPLGVYETRWRKEYGLDLAMHKLMHSYYSSVGDRSLDMLFMLSKFLGAEGFFSKYGDMDRPTIMIKRFFLRGRAK